MGRITFFVQRASTALVNATYRFGEWASHDASTVRGRVARRVLRRLMVPLRPGDRSATRKIKGAAFNAHNYGHAVHRAKQTSNQLLMRHTPPADEHVRFTSIWMVELLTPSTVDPFLRSLRKRRIRPERTDLADWMIDIRGRAPFEGTQGLGTYTRTGSKGPLRRTERARDLPKEFSEVGLQMVSVTRTITAIVARFVLTDEEAGGLERILRTAPRARVVRERGGAIGETFPETIKARDVLHYQRRIREVGRRWLRRRVIGLFGTGLVGGAVPTAELFLVDDEMPLQGDYLSANAQWLRTAHLDGVMGDTWIATDPVGLRAMVPTGLETLEVRHALVLAGSRRHLAHWSSARAAAVGPGAVRLDPLVDFDMDTLAAKWALRSLFEGWEAQSAFTRDASPRAWRRRDSADSLDDLQEFLRTVAIDVEVSADELHDLFGADFPFAVDFPRFLPAPTRLPRPRANTLAGAFQGEYRPRAERLRRSVDRLSETLEAIGSVAAAAAGIRLQRRTFVIAVVSAAVAIASIVIAIRGH